MENQAKDTDDIDQKLAAAQARRAQIEAEREEEAEAARKLRELQDLETLERLEAEYGPLNEELAKVEIRDKFTIFLRRGEKAHWAKLHAHGKKVQDSHINAFVKAHVVFPDVKTVTELADRYPAVWGKCFEALAVLAGHRREEFEGKS